MKETIQLQCLPPVKMFLLPTLYVSRCGHEQPEIFWLFYSFVFYKLCTGHLSLLELQTKTRRQSNVSSVYSFKVYDSEISMSSMVVRFVHAAGKCVSFAAVFNIPCFLQTLYRTPFSSRTPNKDQKVKQYFFCLFIQVL